ncbi:MAG: DUF1415 domain-containing protein [Natronospirillum sp.]
MSKVDQPSSAVNALEQQLWRWLDRVVIDLNLCPFAAAPRRQKAIRWVISSAQDEATVLQQLVDEMIRLDDTPATKLETTLLAVPDVWPDFLSFNEFLGEAEACIERLDREGVYQLASFHPHYQFAGTQPGDAENLTNCAPCAILHLLREERLEAVLARYPAPEEIPARNMVRMRGLSEEDITALFPWRFNR